ncbi:MAG: shikimate dehydrogenase [Planctomycetaceae bacterium]|nr:shikimate dehydrogenase [Planctomycetaceae bacterium]
MICVTIGRTRHRMITAEHAALVERGAKLVELRLDWVSRQPDLNRLLKERPGPVVVTCRRPNDGGRWSAGEDARRMLLRQAIVMGAEYVDLEADIAKAVPRYGATKRIISHHDFQGTPDNLEEIHEALCQCDPDIVKLVTMAQSPADNVRLLKLVASAKVPTIGFCMGELGLASRLLCCKYGSPFTYATFSRDRVLAPGQIPFDDMKSLYRIDFMDSETEVFGVVGDPIAHSHSPLIHNAALQHEGMNAVYLPLRIPDGELPKTLDAYSALDIRGYSVTIPHKQGAAAYARFQDPIVEETGAANTLYKDRTDRWFAANTDYEAALASLRLGLDGRDLAGLRVLMLGAGGVARAIGLGVSRAGCVLTVTNRHKQRAAELAEQLGCTFVTWENRGSVECDILINCTPVGMWPEMNETPFPQHWLRDHMLVFDTIYNPENTLLLKEARDHDCRTVSGLEMFIRQAAAQFEVFANRPAPLDVMREALRRGISAVQRSE